MFLNRGAIVCGSPKARARGNVNITNKSPGRATGSLAPEFVSSLWDWRAGVGAAPQARAWGYRMSPLPWLRRRERQRVKQWWERGENDSM